MFEECQKKQENVKAIFAGCSSEDEKYQKLIELGRSMAHLDAAFKIPENIVKGCQSTMYLRSHLVGNTVVFEAESDALVSAGLAAILIMVFSGETPETILKCPPSYLDDLGISASLTPNRANGLYSIHLRMKQDALKFLIEQEKKKV